MREFLEELKHNQEINKKEGLENRIQIDYIIERLEDIEKDLESYLKDRVKFEVETIKDYINGRF